MWINLLKSQANLREADSTDMENALWLGCLSTSCEAMAATLPPPRILPSGDSAITVEFSRNIDDEANRRVLALDRVLADQAIAGVTEAVPTYRSLLVHYDPVQIGFNALGEKLLALAQRPVPPTLGT